MTNYRSDWILDIGLKLAVAMCLGTLATALFTGVGPITALFRSGAAFTVFAILGWAAALIWRVPKPVDIGEVPEEASQKSSINKDETMKNEDQLRQEMAAQTTEQPEKS